MDMELSEICYRVLSKGLGSLDYRPDFDRIVKDLLRAVLGKRYVKYIWAEKGRENLSQESDSVSRADDENCTSTLRPRQEAQAMTESLNMSGGRAENKWKSVQAFPDERAVEKAYELLIEYFLLPKRRASILRRAERRVAKNELAQARKWIGRKTSTSQDSIHEETTQVELRKVVEAALIAAEKVLAYEDPHAAEKKAQEVGLQALFEMIPTASRPDELMITKALQAAMNAGLETVNEEEGEGKSGMRDAVATKLEKTLNKAVEKVKQSANENFPVLIAAEEIRRHIRLAIQCGEETQDTLETVMAAARKGAERALREDCLNPSATIPGEVENLLRRLEDRVAEAIRNPSRAGQHCLHFLKSEISSTMKREFYVSTTVPVEDAGPLIDRQVSDHLRTLRDKKKLIVSRKRKGFKDLFWGLKGWETDEDRWTRSSANVELAGLAGKLPEFSGKPKTTAAINNECIDPLICETLRLHARWLMTRHFRGIIRLKTGQIPNRSESKPGNDDRGRSDSVEDLPDESSVRFVRDLEAIDIIDKQPMDEQLREYWNAVRLNWNRYHVARKVLKEAGWDDYKINRNKHKLLKLMAKARALEKDPTERSSK